MKKRRDDILSFGESFFEKLSDETLISALAERDLEKLARVFKIVFDKLAENDERKNSNSTLGAIIEAFGRTGGVRGGNETDTLKTAGGASGTAEKQPSSEN